MLAGAPYVSLLEAPGVDRVAAAYQFNAIARRMRPEVATNLFDCLPKLGIGTHPGLRGRRDPGGRRAVAALKPRVLPDHDNRLRTQAQLLAGADPQV